MTPEEAAIRHQLRDEEDRDEREKWTWDALSREDLSHYAHDVYCGIVHYDRENNDWPIRELLAIIAVYRDHPKRCGEEAIEFLTQHIERVTQ